MFEVPRVVRNNPIKTVVVVFALLNFNTLKDGYFSVLDEIGAFFEHRHANIALGEAVSDALKLNGFKGNWDGELTEEMLQAGGFDYYPTESDQGAMRCRVTIGEDGKARVERLEGVRPFGSGPKVVGDGTGDLFWSGNGGPSYTNVTDAEHQAALEEYKKEGVTPFEPNENPTPEELEKARGELRKLIGHSDLTDKQLTYFMKTGIINMGDQSWQLMEGGKRGGFWKLLPMGSGSNALTHMGHYYFTLDKVRYE